MLNAALSLATVMGGLVFRDLYKVLESDFRILGRKDTSGTAMERAMVSHCQVQSSDWKLSKQPRESLK